MAKNNNSPVDVKSVTDNSHDDVTIVKTVSPQNDTVIDLNPLLTPIAIFLSAIMICISMISVGNNLKGGISTSATNTVTTASVATAAAVTTQNIEFKELDYKEGPVLGKADSKIALVEFTDYQCFFCKRHYDQSFGSIKTNLIETGRLVYKYLDYPLSQIHPMAQKAAEASWCANDQGKYIEMKDKMFSVSTGDGSTLTVDKLKLYAKELGMVDADFNTCLDSAKYASKVGTNAALGSNFGVTGTPGLYVGLNSGNNKVNGFLIPGAYPYSTIEAVIKKLEAEGVKGITDNCTYSVSQGAKSLNCNFI